MLNWPIPSMAIGRCLEISLPAVVNLRALKQRRTVSFSYLHSHRSLGRSHFWLVANRLCTPHRRGVRRLGPKNQSAPKNISGQHRTQLSQLLAPLINGRQGHWYSAPEAAPVTLVLDESSGCWKPSNPTHQSALSLIRCQPNRKQDEKDHVDQCIADRRKSDCDH
jgi:hypothetical protein